MLLWLLAFSFLLLEFVGEFRIVFLVLFILYLEFAHLVD